MIEYKTAADAVEPEQGASCPVCGDNSRVEDVNTGEIVCSECGYVLSVYSVSLGQDWKAFTLMENNTRRRTGYPLSGKLLDKGLSTTFQNTRDHSGKMLDYKTQNLMLRLKRHDQRSKSVETWQKNLLIALPLISKLCGKLHLPDHVHEKAAQTYRTVLTNDLVRGRSIDGFVAASTYAACRFYRLPQSILEVAEAVNLTIHDLSYHYRLMVRELDLELPTDDPTRYMSKICNKLNLPGEVEIYAMKILEAARESGLVMGKNPRGVAAATIYLACKEYDIAVTQTKVASIVQTSAITLRKRFLEYNPILEKMHARANEEQTIKSLKEKPI